SPPLGGRAVARAAAVRRKAKSGVAGAQGFGERTRPARTFSRLRGLSRLFVLCVLLLGARAAGSATQRAPIPDSPSELPTLIVTVIDPTEQRLGYLYYRELDSVLAALNNVGFIRIGQTDGGVWSDLGDGVRLGKIDLKRWVRFDGGTVTGISQHVRLLLVPETQYGGVDRSSLQAALETNVDGGSVYVLGPVLSGSAWSLV